MKKLLFTFGLLIASLSFIACSDDDDDKKITFEEIPTISQTFIQTHFAGQEVRLVERDNDSYDVYLKNGFEVEFTLTGEWDDVDGKTQAVPQSVLDLIPAKILDYVAANYDGQSIYEVNKEPFGYEIELSSRVELEFDAEVEFLRIDR